MENSETENKQLKDTKLFRLNPDVRKFFKANWHTDTLPLRIWRERGVSFEILDEVSSVFITYGIQDGIRTDLSGWSDKEGKKILFTVHVPHLSMNESDKLNVAELMDILQLEIDRFVKSNHFGRQ